MAVYRYQVVCVGFWRGLIKRWNTTFHMSSSGNTTYLYSRMNAVGYPNPGDGQGACSGGVASISVYSSAGGAPLSRTEYFDWQTPGTWIPYTGTAWGDVDPGTPLDASGESAVVVAGRLPGLSATGKPVFTRKYLHAIPSRTSLVYGDHDLSMASQANIAAQLNASTLLSPSGIQPTSVEVEPYYFNHQRVRGRRRAVAQRVANGFGAGVVAGAGAGAAAAGAAPFPGQ